nr:MAG TPA: hypothetical protein [Caudoviricetes sp.]
MTVDEGTAVKIERDILQYLDAVKKDRGLTDEKWGESAFQGSVNGRRKIQNLKKPQANGQPQKLCISDFVRLCAPLGVDPTRVLSKALEENNL